MRPKITLIVTVSVVIYAIIGGVAFHYIEQGYEIELLPQVLQEFSLYTVEGGGLNCLNWSDIVLLSGILKDLSDGGFYITQSGQLLNGTKWDVRTAIFGAISIFTSVGYHRMEPDFIGGRIFSVIYGWIGIVLFYCAVKVVRTVIGRAMKVIGRRLCGRKVSPLWNKILRNGVALVLGFTLFMLIPAVIFSHLEKWNYGESLYFCFCTLFTIGFGDYTPGFNHDVMPSEDTLHWYRLATGFWVIILTTFFISQLIRVIEIIDDSSEKTEYQIDQMLSSYKETAPSKSVSRPEVTWFNGTSVMINGTTQGPTASREVLGPSTNSGWVPATGTPGPHRPMSSEGFVTVISTGQN